MNSIDIETASTALGILLIVLGLFSAPFCVVNSKYAGPLTVTFCILFFIYYVLNNVDLDMDKFDIRITIVITIVAISLTTLYFAIKVPYTIINSKTLHYKVTNLDINVFIYGVGIAFYGVLTLLIHNIW